MNKKATAILAAIPLALSAWVTVNAQEEEDAPPYVTPVDTFTCNYNDGKGPDDLKKAAADWNVWMDNQGTNNYGAVTLTPYYYGDDSFDVGWLGFWTNQEAMGEGIDSYLTKGTKQAEGFSKVVTCDTHEHWATINVKKPKEGPPPDNFVLMFSNCTIGEDTEWEALKAGIDEAAAYMTEQNFGNGAWMMWRVFGGAGEPDWDFKWVTSYDNYTDFGKAYQHNANGGGRQKMNEIMGDMLDCDSARVYNATTVRRIAGGDGE
jgi:hypothetical protein